MFQDVQGLFRYFPPSPTDKNIIPPPPLADAQLSSMVQVSVYYKVIANTCLFTLTSFSKQSASWRVLEICVLCAQSTDSQKTYSVNTLVAAATASTGGGGNNLLGGGIICWGGNNLLGGGGITEKTRCAHNLQFIYTDADSRVLETFFQLPPNALGGKMKHGCIKLFGPDQLK